jgi:hypothetical protein
MTLFALKIKRRGIKTRVIYEAEASAREFFAVRVRAQNHLSSSIINPINQNGSLVTASEITSVVEKSNIDSECVSQ